MRKVGSAIIGLVLMGIMTCVLFPATLSAYTINGSTVTLEASDRTADNTTLIQGFLNNATYTKIIIPPGQSNASWPVKPLFLNHNNTEIHLNSNTVLEALTGGYPNGGDCVLTAISKDIIKITGDAGSKILMHKEEYALLAAAEGRAALTLMTCSNVTVSGLTLANTGGDGIYLGDAIGSYSSNVAITNVITDGAGRNGLSVISVDGLTVTGCTFKNTQGQGNVAIHGPWAGIDLEPNSSSNRLKNIVIDNCAFLNNSNWGFLQNTSRINGSTGILSMTINNCTMQGNVYGIGIGNVPASLNDSSSITFQNCTISDNQNYGVWIPNKARDAGTLSFTNCSLNNNNLVGGNTAFCIENHSGATEVGGNIQLNNIVVVQPTNRSVSYFLSIDGTYASIDNVSGNIYASGGLLYKTNTTNLDITTASNVTPLYPSTDLFLHHWKMDETGSSGTAYDSNGNCNGTLLNSPAWVTGRIGGGLALNGVNQFVTVANDPSLNIGTGDFSISLWMQRSDSTVTNKRLLYKGASADTEIGYALSGSNTALCLMLCNGVSRLYTNCSIPSLNQWHHFVFTFDRVNGKIKSYVDGIYQTVLDISAYNGVDISNTRDLLIGAASAGGLAWPGAVDDVRIYKRVLSSGEIAYLAADASAWWTFDDGSGSAAADCVGRSTGMLQNNPAWTTGKFGGALELNGINQFVSVSNNSSDLNIGTGDFSISLWMQRSDSAVTNKRLLYKGASADTEIGYALSGSNTTLCLMLCNGVTRLYTNCSIPSLNQWHHFVFTFNRVSGKVKSYVDGVYQTTPLDISAYNGVDISNTRDLLIGAASAGGLAWPGKIDDVRIFKRVLSADEVVLLYSTP